MNRILEIDRKLLVFLLAVSLSATSCRKEDQDSPSQLSGAPAEAHQSPGSAPAAGESGDHTGTPQPPPSQEPSAAAEEYEEVNPAELSFEIRDYNYDGVVAAGGGVKPIGGHIGALLCEGQAIPLAKDEFDNGFVITKEYGKIKIVFGASLYRESFAVYLTPKQKEALAALKSR